MTINGDIILKNTVWKDGVSKFVDEKSLFRRNVDLFIVACSIGIYYDKREENDMNDDDQHILSIGRNTYMVKNEDLNYILNFLFQNAILNTKTIDINPDVRLNIAFDPDYDFKIGKQKFNPASFLVEFASYGMRILLSKYETIRLKCFKNINDFLDELLEKNNK